jgi:hypothetical protein
MRLLMLPGVRVDLAGDLIKNLVDGEARHLQEVGQGAAEEAALAGRAIQGGRSRFGREDDLDLPRGPSDGRKPVAAHAAIARLAWGRPARVENQQEARDLSAGELVEDPLDRDAAFAQSRSGVARLGRGGIGGQQEIFSIGLQAMPGEIECKGRALTRGTSLPDQAAHRLPKLLPRWVEQGKCAEAGALEPDIDEARVA